MFEQTALKSMARYNLATIVKGCQGEYVDDTLYQMDKNAGEGIL